jgi:uracil DNA glycosylase
MSNQLSKEDLIERLVQKYENSPWNNILVPIIKNPIFTPLVAKWLEDVTSGATFTPPMKDIFKSMMLCPPDDVRVVFINGLPFEGSGQADGLALSGYVQNANAKFFADAFPTDPEDLPQANLEYLVKQGVLMLNVAATCTLGKPDSHAILWGPVTKAIIESMQDQTGIIYVFVGDAVEAFGSLISEHNYKMFIPNPDKKNWNDMDIFNIINSILKKNTGDVIKW